MPTAFRTATFLVWFAALLLTAAASKVAAGDVFPATLKWQGLPDVLALPLSHGVILTEIAVSMGLASSIDPPLSFAAVAALMV
jgi:acid phosphatase family membrane protein YuiD